jgi:hypothetical protein
LSLVLEYNTKRNSARRENPAMIIVSSQEGQNGLQIAKGAVSLGYHKA